MSDSPHPPLTRVTPGWALFMTLQMALWGLSYPVIAIATGDAGLESLSLTLLRTLGAGLLLLPLVIWEGAHGRLPHWRTALAIAAWGAWYFGGALTLFNTSIAIGAPILSGIIFAGFPVVLALLGALLKVEPWDRRAVPYVFLALLGALLVITDGHLERLAVLTANTKASLLMLSSMVMVAGYALGAKHLLQEVPPLTFTGIALLGGSLALVLIALATGLDLQGDWTSASREVQGAVIYLCVMNSLITEWMSMHGLRRLSLVIVGVFNYLQPLFVVLFSLLLPATAQPVSLWLGIGTLAILCGASAVGTMQPGVAPWPERMLRRRAAKSIP